jgi:hypothetical protein
MFGFHSISQQDKCWILLAKYGLKMLILTCGTDGSYVFTPGKISFQPTPRVAVADTVGAGDSFTGAFTAAILAGKPVEEAHKLAVEVSAFVCTQSGAMPVLPDELGKVVVVLNGRYAGSKGIIVKSNYESVKDRKYPHCIVVGLSKGPRKPTKKNLAKLQAKIKKLEASKDSNDRLNALKSFGVFIKTYNMSHLLATRYTVKEDFGINKSLEKVDALEKKVKEDKTLIEAKEKAKKEESAKDIESLKAKLGNDLNEYKSEVRNAKSKIGGEMYKRFMQGFNKGKKEEEIESQQNTQFLFKKLKF